MERRYKLMSTLGVRNLSGYNGKVAEAKRTGKPLGNPFTLTPEVADNVGLLGFLGGDLVATEVVPEALYTAPDVPVVLGAPEAVTLVVNNGAGTLLGQVTFTVQAPPSYGLLNGTVTGLAACNINPLPMQGAYVYGDYCAGVLRSFRIVVSHVKSIIQQVRKNKLAARIMEHRPSCMSSLGLPVQPLEAGSGSQHGADGPIVALRFCPYHSKSIQIPFS